MKNNNRDMIRTRSVKLNFEFENRLQLKKRYVSTYNIHLKMVRLTKYSKRNIIFLNVYFSSKEKKEKVIQKKHFF